MYSILVISFSFFFSSALQERCDKEILTTSPVADTPSTEAVTPEEDSDERLHSGFFSFKIFNILW